MEEYNLFNKLTNLKCEIEKDFHFMDRIQNDLRTKTVYESNRNISLKIQALKDEFIAEKQEIEKEKSEMEIKLNDSEILSKDKEKEFEKLHLKIKELSEDRKHLEKNLHFLKAENSRLEKSFNNLKQNDEIESKTRDYLQKLYEKEMSHNN